MPRKSSRSAEEKYQIVPEGLRSGNIAETCRKHGVVPTQYYRWKDEAEKGTMAALGGRSTAAPADAEQARRVRELERLLGKAHAALSG